MATKGADGPALETGAPEDGSATSTPSVAGRGVAMGPHRDEARSAARRIATSDLLTSHPNRAPRHDYWHAPVTCRRPLAWLCRHVRRHVHAILDVQVVATSLTAIQSSLGIAPDQLSWLQTAYLIAEVIAIPLTGYLTRLLTGRWLFVAAISTFSVASVGCALSGSFEMLVGWRVLQGFAGGTLIPSVFSAVFMLLPQRGRATATTLAGLLAVLAPTLGAIVAGWITETFSWHWLFLINVAPGIVAAIAAALFLPREQPDREAAGRLDWLALLLLAIALGDFLADIDADRGKRCNGGIHGLLLRLMRSSLGARRGEAAGASNSRAFMRDSRQGEISEAAPKPPVVLVSSTRSAIYAR